MKKRRTFYGYYALPILGILIVAILAVGAITVIFFWPAGVAILNLGFSFSLPSAFCIFQLKRLGYAYYQVPGSQLENILITE